MTSTDLERARGLAPSEGLSLERLEQRRERKEAHRRIGALIVVGSLVVLVAGAFIADGGARSSVHTPGAQTESEAWTMPPGLAIPAGGYAYVHRVGYGSVEAFEEQSWFSPSDGSGRVRETGTSSNEPVDSEVEGEQIPYVDDQTYAPGELTSGEVPNLDPLDDLSTDPEVLAGQLVARSGPAGASPLPPPTTVPNQAASTQQVVRVAAGLMQRANATPELKAALSQVLVGLDGVTVNDATMDPVGRSAWSVAFENHAKAQTWWFDPTSDQLLVERTRSVAGDYTFFMVFEESGVVSGTHATETQPSFIPSTTAAP
jgi:hypothetical protein